MVNSSHVFLNSSIRADLSISCSLLQVGFAYKGKSCFIYGFSSFILGTCNQVLSEEKCELFVIVPYITFAEASIMFPVRK